MKLKNSLKTNLATLLPPFKTILQHQRGRTAFPLKLCIMKLRCFTIPNTREFYKCSINPPGEVMCC